MRLKERVLVTIAVLVLAVLIVPVRRVHAEERSGCSARESAMPVRVRALSPALRDALQDGIRRSALLASLVERIERSDGVVFLIPGGINFPNAGRLLGGLSHRIVAGPDYRVLQIVIWQRPGDLMIATVGHELRHALEVLDAPEAIDQRSVEQLYDRIGLKLRSSVYETEAAERAGDDVRTELARCRS